MTLRHINWHLGLTNDRQHLNLLDINLNSEMGEKRNTIKVCSSKGGFAVLFFFVVVGSILAKKCSHKYLISTREMLALQCQAWTLVLTLVEPFLPGCSFPPVSPLSTWDGSTKKWERAAHGGAFSTVSEEVAFTHQQTLLEQLFSVKVLSQLLSLAAWT